MRLSLSIITLLIFFESLLSAGLQKSWVESANDPETDFPIQNLPYGVFAFREGSQGPRICTAIGDRLLDLKGCVEAGLFLDLDHSIQAVLQEKSLNAFMALDEGLQLKLRQKVTELLDTGNQTIRDNEHLKQKLLIPQSHVNLLLPIEIGDYTDFYASLHHALHVGSLFRPDNPLMPNYKHMPIGYHGRSSSVVVSKTVIDWPSGQVLQNDGTPKLSKCQMLDYELEVGAVIGKGNALGAPIAIDDAESHIFGLVLLNDWSARDIQKWEYQPLGPFNGKNFATTISPWIVALDALKPFRKPLNSRADTDPALLGYLSSSKEAAYDITVEAYIASDAMRRNNLEPQLLCRGNLRSLYWSFDQMACHHTSSGCNLRTGDLLGSGTISGPSDDSLGCFLERAAFKLDALNLPDGTTRKSLEDGDEIILRAYAKREGWPRIGFGECRGTVVKDRSHD